MNRTLTFAGTDLETFGAHFTNGGNFPSPVRAYERVEVLGRNGDIFIDNGKYNNVQNSYPCFIEENFRENYNDLIAFLSLNTGYQRLEDSLDPDVYRMAVYSGGVEPSIKSSDIMGNFKLVFNCKPQRFLKQDEEGISLEGASLSDPLEFSNPTHFTSKPLLKVYADSEIRIRGNASFGLYIGNFTSDYSYLAYGYIDCETLDFYSEGGVINLSPYLTISTYTAGNEKFPFFRGDGNFNIYAEGGSGTAVLYPRWWTI